MISSGKSFTVDCSLSASRAIVAHGTEVPSAYGKKAKSGSEVLPLWS